jgi:tRNA U38,U39,U40 pseudouridine synthase TruA
MTSEDVVDITTDSSNANNARNGTAEVAKNSMSLTLTCLTLVMTIEYNGFQYAGFQRQTATPRCTTQSQHHQQQQQQQCPNTRSKKNSSIATTITIQDKIERALQQWTNLSLETLRVRGAGRTDKGVHASGQVVAFDVPIRLLCDSLSLGSHEDCMNIHSSTARINTSSNARDGGINEVLSNQSAQLLQDAYSTLSKHYQYEYSKTDDNNEKSICNINIVNSTKELIDQWQIRRAITTRLPPDIVLRSVRIWAAPGVPQQQNFEPRKKIACKVYTYQLRFRSCSLAQFKSNDSKMEMENKDTNRNIHPICKAGPHLLRRINDQNTIWLCTWPLDPALLRPACKAFVGNHDFINFVHKEERKKATSNNNKKNQAFSVDEKKSKSPHEIDLFEFNVDSSFERADEIDPSVPPVINATFTLKAKGFHRSMVRNLVGFVVDVARGFRSVHDIPMLLLEKESETESETCRPMMGSNEKAFTGMVNSAPACGLCLANVEFENNWFL